MFVLYVVLRGCVAQSKQESNANAEIAWIQAGALVPFILIWNANILQMLVC